MFLVYEFMSVITSTIISGGLSNKALWGFDRLMRLQDRGSAIVHIILSARICYCFKLLLGLSSFGPEE